MSALSTHLDGKGLKASAMSPEVLIVLLSTWISKILDDLLVLRELNPCFARVAFASFQVIRKVAFLCVFNCIICQVSSTLNCSSTVLVLLIFCEYLC